MNFFLMKYLYGLDYLVKDFQYLLDLIIKSVDNRTIYEHVQFDVLFELAHSVNNLLDTFCKKYISKTFNEKWNSFYRSPQVLMRTLLWNLLLF